MPLVRVGAFVIPDAPTPEDAIKLYRSLCQPELFLSRGRLSPSQIRYARQRQGAICLACGDEAATLAVCQRCLACADPTKYTARQTEISFAMDCIFSYLPLKDWQAAAAAGVVALNPFYAPRI